MYRYSVRLIKTINFNDIDTPSFTRDGELFIPDEKGNRIIKIFSDGSAGSYTIDREQGLLNGKNSNAKFGWPKAVDTDSKGNLYISDSINNCIRVINSRGEVSTFAGSVKGDLDGFRTEATFFRPYGISIDDKDNIFVADNGNHAVRKIATDGQVTTITSGKSDFLWRIRGLATDRKGFLYIAADNLIVKISPKGKLEVIAGSEIKGFKDGTISEALFSYPGGLDVDSMGNVFVADTGNRKIRVISAEGFVYTLFNTEIIPEDVILSSEGNLYLISNMQVIKLELIQERVYEK